MRTRLSEREKLYWMCILFPIFWPFLIYLVLEDICSGIRLLFQIVWGATKEKIAPACKHEGEVVSASSYTEREDHPGGPIGNDQLLIEYKTTVRLCKKCGEQYSVTTWRRV